MNWVTNLTNNKPEDGRLVVIKRRSLANENSPRPVISHCLWSYNRLPGVNGGWHSKYGGDLEDNMIVYWKYVEELENG